MILSYILYIDSLFITTYFSYRSRFHIRSLFLEAAPLKMGEFKEKNIALLLRTCYVSFLYTYYFVFIDIRDLQDNYTCQLP